MSYRLQARFRQVAFRLEPSQMDEWGAPDVVSYFDTTEIPPTTYCHAYDNQDQRIGELSCTPFLPDNSGTLRSTDVLWQVETVAVDPHLRGRGVATALYNAFAQGEPSEMVFIHSGQWMSSEAKSLFPSLAQRYPGRHFWDYRDWIEQNDRPMPDWLKAAGIVPQPGAYYHLSNRPLPLGTVLTPNGPGGTIQNFKQLYGDEPWRKDKVFVTKNPAYWEAMVPSAYIYRVEPLGPLKGGHDTVTWMDDNDEPDIVPMEFMVDSARIVEIIQQPAINEKGDFALVARTRPTKE